MNEALRRNLTMREKLHYGIPLTEQDLAEFEIECFERGSDTGYDEGFKEGTEATITI